MTEMRKRPARDRAVAKPGIPGPAGESMARMSEMLMAQALSLDAMFGELAGHAANNLGTWPRTAESFTRLALRAQANCRASLEAMVKADRAARSAREAAAE